MPIPTYKPYAAKAIIEHEFDVDHVNVYVTFRFDMNQAAKPDNDLWVCLVDDVEKAVTDSDWVDEYTMLLTVANIATYPDRVTLEYNGPSIDLQISWGKTWEPWGAILSKDIGKAPGFVDRGDPAAYDYDKTDLTIDGAWHDLDLSAIVPAKAKAVFLLGHVEGAAVDWAIIFRKNGNGNEIVHSGMETLRAGVERHRSSICAIDDDRIIEYKADNENWTSLNLVVKGWWF